MSTDKDVLAQTAEDLVKFQNRDLGVLDKQETLTYIESMLTAKNAATSREERVLLARNLIAQSADPFIVNQGRHNTCAIAALEVRTYVKHPAHVARLIAEVAVSGGYATNGGDRIVLDEANLRPDEEAVGDGRTLRSYASQLFQLTAANVYWQRQNTDPRGISCKRGKIHYLQQKRASGVRGDTGERLVIRWDNGVSETVCDDSGRAMNQPCFSLPEVMAVSSTISDNDAAIVLAGGQFDKRHKYTHVKSEGQLCSHLAQCKLANTFPIVVAVDSTKGWFNESPTFEVTHKQVKPGSVPVLNDFGRGGWHAVCITDFDMTTNKVSIDNFWGPSADRMGIKAVALSQMYQVIQMAQK